ncbi:hypothetical protein LUZ61_017611 [Rhynchospora tenuis]|uniref:Uncharacterized protein n=1 Tax=Rhynchospora tenuis TaxID=198213 RepID=A0AAD5Z7R7_9POAL|nr:hypothetical protein LUZ61_017611 [Rhynchospora tenuis]
MALSNPLHLTFTTRRSKPIIIRPAIPTPYEFKPLSDIDDQEALRFYNTGVIFCPKNHLMSGQDPAQIIKSALEKALVYYYPFAGRIHEGPDRKLVVECNGEGIVFVEADADVRLEDFGDAFCPPIPCHEDLLCVPETPVGDVINRPLLYIQVTRLKCEGFIFGIQHCHCMADSSGIAQFLAALGELARGANCPSVQPLWAREILSARVMTHITHRHPEYDYTPEKYSLPYDSLVHRSFFFSQKEISVLKEHLSPKLRRFATKFELIAACLWKCRTIAVGYNPREKVRLMFVVDARGKRSLKIPKGYYGTALAFPVAEAEAGELCQHQLSYAVQLVTEAKARATADGYMQSVADLLVSKGRPHFAMDSRTFLVSELTHNGLEGIDFGWGKPVYLGPATVSIASYCIGMQNKKGERGIRASMHLPECAMERFCLEMERFTKTSSYVCESSFELDMVSKL